MHYNVKVFLYPNGEKQVRYYTEPQFLKDDEPMAFKVENAIARDKQFDLTHAVEPFTNTVCKIVDNFDVLERERQQNLFSSFNRTKKKVYEYARCEYWDWFVTLTLDKANVDRYDYALCSKKVRTWLNNVKKRFADGLKYLVVPEQHKDGAWHFHAFFCCADGLNFVYSGIKDKKGKAIFNIAEYKLGFSTATRVVDIHRASKYIGKYVTKTLCDVTYGKQRYFVSKNINKPDSFIMFFDMKEENLLDFVDTFAASFGQECRHISSVGNENSYTKVKYFEIN